MPWWFYGTFTFSCGVVQFLSRLSPPTVYRLAERHVNGDSMRAPKADFWRASYATTSLPPQWAAAPLGASWRGARALR